MAFPVTGRTLTLEINSVVVSAKTMEATLTPSQDTTVSKAFTATYSNVDLPSWELNVKSFQDWNEASSFAEALTTAAAAGTAIPFELGVDGGVWSGDIIPVYFPVGGSADSVLELDVTFPVTGNATYTPNP